uniref:Uncharacterized protein n=1 Tax=Amphimedon queenslandica TaxID=400682 RepID=A0A1X7UQS6_AMPQE
DFKDIYQLIGTPNLTEEEIHEVQGKAIQWIRDFITFPYNGYSKSNVMPYMHVLAFHVPSSMRHLKGTKKIASQGSHTTIFIREPFIFIVGEE